MCPETFEDLARAPSKGPRNAVPGSVTRRNCSDKKGGTMKHVSNKTMKLSMRIGLAVAASLLATHVSTGRASAGVQDLTVTSITRTNLTTIQVSGTVTFSAGDVGADLRASLSQIIRGQIPTQRYGYWQSPDNPVPGDPSSDPPVTYSWTVDIGNNLGWKPGKAILSVEATSFDPTAGDFTRRTWAASVVLPR
jgi:hypothetical protein